MRKLWILLMLLWCVVPVYGAELPEELTDAIPDSARELLDVADK